VFSNFILLFVGIANPVGRIQNVLCPSTVLSTPRIVVFVSAVAVARKIVTVAVLNINLLFKTVAVVGPRRPHSQYPLLIYFVTKCRSNKIGLDVVVQCSSQCSNINNIVLKVARKIAK
jgi:hypothetical protein